MRVELLSWDDARDHATPIRFTVFVEEQGVPADIELDEHDAVCVHAVAFDGTRAIGTGRLLPDGHIGRMAVLKESRNAGVGALLLTKLMEKAKEKGFAQVALSAQIHAARFYRRHGFVEEGPEYVEAGIRHQAMRRAL